MEDMTSKSPQVLVAEKLKPNEVPVFDEMDVGLEALIGHNKVEVSTKGKPKFGHCDTWQNDIEDATSSDPGNYLLVAGSVDSSGHLKSSTSGSANSNNVNRSNSDLSYDDDDDADDGGGEELGDDGDDYADDGSDYYDNDDCLYEDDYLTMQSQFDNVDLPPGVEASLPWLKNAAPNGNITSSTGTSTALDTSENKMKSSIPSFAEIKVGTSGLSENKNQLASESSSTDAAGSSSSNGEVAEENFIAEKFKNFKQFDLVEDFSDHHYSRMGFSEQQPPKSWAKRIQEEWKILENDLPDTIYIRVYESRIELLRAVIVGPSSTPYHDGLFVFDCLFPPTYPNEAPMVYYYSGGLRINPNLYECGKVCLSLLGTWSGKQNEMWMAGKSTMLQVLVSIQALILNAKPFFNEPGYESMYVGADGEKRSNKYNEDAFILSLKTMMYTLRKPPKYFEDFVVGHFHNRAHDILVVCKAYMKGATVGTVAIKDGAAVVNKAERNASGEFRATVKKMINILITTFSRFGSINCEQFRIKN